MWVLSLISSEPDQTRVTLRRIAVRVLSISVALLGVACHREPVSTLVTIDLPPLPPNGQFGTDVTLPGVSPSDQLLLSPTQFAGTWGIYYKTKDTVVVHYANTTGEAQDPPPIT